jgi:uncharacterized protein YutE (UPF0331/DUF86 family)
MTQADENIAVRAQKKVARKYKVLGYDVLENPDPRLLPEFMRGITPDIIARSKSDNVIIEVKNHTSLKGSNDLISIAERVSGHPEWRFELVVLDENENDQFADSGMEYERLLDKIQIATSVRLFDVAYVYLVNVLVETTRDLAGKYNIKYRGKTDRDLLIDLGFKGVLPKELLQQCLSSLSRRDKLAHALGEVDNPSADDLKDLLWLYEQLKQLF